MNCPITIRQFPSQETDGDVNMHALGSLEQAYIQQMVSGGATFYLAVRDLLTRVTSDCFSDDFIIME